jgi:FkbM family methyltransferase
MKSAKQSVVIFGVGVRYALVSAHLPERYNIVALLDNDVKKQGKVVDGLTVAPADAICSLNYDMVALTVENFFDVVMQLFGLGVPNEKITLLTPPGVSFAAQDDTLEVTKDAVRMRLRYADTFVWREIFIYEAYGCYFGDNVTAIDVGMNIGDTALYLANKEWVREVYSFEPFPVYEQAVANVGLNSRLAQKIVLQNYGLTGGKSGKMEHMHYDAGDTLGNNIYQTAHGGGVAIELRNATEALRPILEKAKALCSPVLLKIDAEGAEFDILDDLCKSGLLRDVNAILMEMHLFMRLGGLDDLRVILQKSGFKYKYNLEFGHLRGMLYAIR